jgi:GTP-sensing pleiotropic transcriptional regulator CodY
MEPLAKLFGSGARVKTLRLFLFNKDSAFTLTDVAERAKLTKEVARQELTDLCAAGLLRKKSTQAPVRYQTDPRFEHLDSLNTFIRETTSVHPQNMIKSLKRVGTLRLVVLSGFFTDILEAQVDLLIVGDNLEQRVLASVVRSLEADLGREIRYASFPTADFRYRLGVYDRLLRDIFDYPHRLLIDKIGL